MIRDVIEREYSGLQVYSAPVHIRHGGGVIDVGPAVKALQEQSATLRRVTVDPSQTVTLRGDVDIQVNDSLGAPISEPALLKLWVSATEHGAPSGTNNTVAVETGTIVQQVTANAQYLILTDDEGHAEVRVTLSGAADRFVMVAIGDRVVASPKLEIAVIE